MKPGFRFTQFFRLDSLVMKEVFVLEVARRKVRIALHDRAAADCFPQPLCAFPSEKYDVSLSDREMIRSREMYSLAETDAIREYKMLLWPTADYLLETGACIVHCVSIDWHGRAWLLCAPSGTGKTTQFLRWRQVGGFDVRLINGDMSVVSMELDDRILVWDSPWRGKECWIGDPGPVPLGGIIFLEQAEQNEMVRLNPGHELHRIVKGISSRPRTEQSARMFATIANGILKHPVWLLKNRGDVSSAQMAMNMIRAEGDVEE